MLINLACGGGKKSNVEFGILGFIIQLLKVDSY